MANSYYDVSPADTSLASMFAKQDELKAKAAPSCNCSELQAKFKADKDYNKYATDHRVKNGKMEAVSPPGFKHTVEHMKNDHKDIDNPFALAWYMKDKGHAPKTNTDKMSAGGPGSGRHPQAGIAEKAVRPLQHKIAANYHGDYADRIHNTYLGQKPYAAQALINQHLDAQDAHIHAVEHPSEQASKNAQVASKTAHILEDKLRTKGLLTHSFSDLTSDKVAEIMNKR